MIKTWEQTPFFSSSGALQENETETALPFSIGAVTKQGSDHIRLGLSNQDALNIKLDENLIIGVLCDGCSTNHETLINDYSYNHVGASLLSQLIVNLCYQNMKNRKNRVNKSKFLKWLTKNTVKQIKKLTKNIHVEDQNQIAFLNNLMTTTIIGFIIRKNEFFVFHCGDGIVNVNDTVYDLSFDSGRYITGFVNKNNNKSTFKLIDSGETSKLNHLYIASDGFQENTILDSSGFKNILNKNNQKHTGFIDLIPEFHLKVLNDFYELNYPNEEQWPTDDSSLIMLRRTIKQKK